jgi:hypothetical protein
VTLICLILQQRYKRKPVLTQLNSLTFFVSLEKSLSEWSLENRSFKSVFSMNSVHHYPLTRSSSMLLEVYCLNYYQTLDPDGLISPSDNLPTSVVPWGTQRCSRKEGWAPIIVEKFLNYIKDLILKYIVDHVKDTCWGKLISSGMGKLKEAMTSLVQSCGAMNNCHFRQVLIKFTTKNRD